MTRRRLAIAVLLFGAIFLAAVILSIRPGGRPSAGSPAGPRVPAARDAGQPMTVSSGFDFSETLRGRPLFRIRADRTVAFGAGPGHGLGPNLYSGEDVALTVYPDEGDPVTVRAERAEYDSRTRGATLEGNVRWTDPGGALGETARILFHPTGRTLEAPGPVHVARGTLDLRASSGVYDVATRVLRLGGPVEGAAAGEDAAGLSSLAADSALYRREEGVVELVGSVRAGGRDGNRLSAARLLVKLAADGGRVLWARASGDVRGELSSSDPVAAAIRRSYAGSEAALFLTPEGEARSLTLSGRPAVISEPGRRLHAPIIEVAFEKGRAVSARARNGVSIEAGTDRARADRAQAAFGPDGRVETIELDGDARMRGKDRSARADRVVELPGRSIWILTGEGGRSATVERSGSRVSASRIEIDDSRKTLRAEGNARALFVPAKSREPSPRLLGDGSRPTQGKADRMVFDEASRTASLSGGAALWQDASTLFGNDITINDAQRTLAAVGDARAVLAPGASPGGRDDRQPSILTARRLLYRESEATAAFDGGVAATRGSWRATGATGTATLGPGRKIERVELSGGVSLTDAAAGRTGQAERATDYPQEGKTVLEGSPARVTDREGNRVSGATLTITGRGRSVEVTAPEGGRTETIHRTRPD